MTEEQGMPIYFDDAQYTIVDSLSESPGPHHLFPANAAAQKLYRCIECMRDISETLETTHQAKAEDKQRRRLKLFFTPLFSFVDCLIDLLHDIQTNPQTKGGLPSETASLAMQLERRLKANIPFGSSQPLREIRNKMSAHADKQMHPVEAQKLFSDAKPHVVGLWLHCALTVLTDVLKLPIYEWSCESRFPNCVGFMSPDLPLLTVFGLEAGKLSHIAGLFLLKRDPRTEVSDLLRKIVEQSRWMFRWNDQRILFFQEDQRGSKWAKSLDLLPEKGWKPQKAADEHGLSN